MQDELVYWNAMAALRKEEAALAKFPYVSGTRYDCKTELCAGVGWAGVEINVAPSYESLRNYIVPKDYFQFCQRYVATALQNKPSLGAQSTAKAKILWLLDVQAHVTYGWLALGIPLWWIAARISQLFPPTSNFGAVWTPPDNVGGIGRPAPFYASPIQLAGYIQPYTPDGADDTIRGTGLLTKLINEVQPWLKDGFRLKSRDDRDASIYNDAVAHKDSPLTRGIVQARMWAIIDYDWPKTFRGQKPMATWRYGAADSGYSSALLTAYINNVSRYESADAQINHLSGSGTAYQNYGDFPNLAWSLDNLSAITTAFPAVDFDQLLAEYSVMWIAHAAPAPGKDPVVQSPGVLVSGEPWPLSIDDYKLADNNELTQLKARAVMTDDMDTSKMSAVELKAYQQYKKYAEAIKSFPGGAAFASIGAKASKVVAPLLFKIGGFARGVSLIPKFFRVIEMPFYRSLKADDYRTIPDGPTPIALGRCIVAMANIQRVALVGVGKPVPVDPRVTALLALQKMAAAAAPVYTVKAIKIKAPTRETVRV